MRFSLKRAFAAMAYVALAAAAMAVVDSRITPPLIWALTIFAFCNTSLVIALGGGKQRPIATGYILCVAVVKYAAIFASTISSGWHANAFELSRAGEAFYFEAWPEIDLSVAGPLRAMSVNGKRVEYYDVGKGPVLLMVHGAGTDATDWKGIIEPLAHHYRLIIPDGMVYAYNTDDVWQLLDYLKIDRLALVGHSAGCDANRELYFRQPSRFWAFVNIDSDAIGGRAFADDLPNDQCSQHVKLLHQQNDNALAALEPTRVNDFPSAVNVARLQLYYRVRKQRPDVTKNLVPPPESRPVPKATIVTVPILNKFAPVPTKSRFRCPVLVFNAGYGKTDGADPPQLTAAWKGGPLLAEVYKFILVRDSGHWIWIDQPELFLYETSAFLKKYAPVE